MPSPFFFSRTNDDEGGEPLSLDSPVMSKKKPSSPFMFSGGGREGLPEYLQVREMAKQAHHDPKLRGAMLDEINAPTQGLQRHPINPFEEPGKWFNKTVENLWEPVKESWNSDKWYGKPLAVLEAPLQILGAPVTGLTTALGYDHASSGLDVGLQYAADPTKSTGEALAATGLGLAVDFANPFFWVSQGAKPLTKAAEKLLAEPVGTAGLRDATQIETVARTSRHGPRLTGTAADLPAIQENVAPRMLAKNYYDTFQEMETGLKGVHIPKTVGNPDVFAAVFGENKNAKILDGGKSSYQDVLNVARKDKSLQDLTKNHSEFPRDMLLSNAPLDQKLDALAKHQVYTEKAIMDGRARTRVYGVDVGPSLTKGLADTTSKLLGTWKEAETLNTPLSKLVPPDRMNNVNNFFRARGMDFDAAATPTHLFNQLERVQDAMFKKGGFAGAITNEKDLGNWIKNEVLSIPQTERLEHLSGIRDVYQTVLDVLRPPDGKPFKGVTSLNPSRVEKALKTVDGWINTVQTMAPDTLEGVPKALHGILTDPKLIDARKQFYLQAREGRVKQLLNDVEKLVGEQHAGIRGVLGGSQGPQTKEAIMEALARSVSTAKGAFADAAGKTQDLPRMLKTLLSENNRLLNAKTAYPYSASWRQMRMNTNEMMRNIHNTLQNSQTLIHDALLKPKSAPMDGLMLVGDVLDKGGQRFWEDLGSQSGASVSWVNPKAIPLPQHQAALVMDKINKHVDELVSTKMMDSARANTVKSYIGGLDPPGLTNLVYSMGDLAKAKAKGSLQAALLERLTEPFRPLMEKIHYNLLTEHDHDLREIMSDMDRFQAYYEPHKITNWLMKTGGPVDRLNKIMSSALIKSGFSPLLPDVLRGMVQSQAAVPGEARKFGLNTVSKENILGAFRGLDPVRFSRIGPAMEEKINMAVGDVLQFEHAIDRTQRQLQVLLADPGRAQLPSVKTLQRELKVAQDRVASGKASLKGILGDDATVNNVLQKINGNLKALQDREFAEERKLGMQGVYREHYHPYYLTGNEADKDIARRLMSHTSEVGGLPFSDRTQISRHFRHQEKRFYPDQASVQAFINEVNEDPSLWGVDHKLDVKVGSNLAAAYAIRKSNQIKTLVNRDALAKINAVLPGGMVTMSLGPPSKKAVETGLNWKSLEPLIPSMSSHYVPEALYSYMEHFVPEHRQADEVWGMFHKVNSWLARQMVRYNLVHLKNIGSLAAVSGIDTSEVGKMIDYAWKNRHPFSRDYNNLERMSMALDEHPIYQDSVRNGITHFDPDTMGKSVDEMVEAAMKPPGSRAVAYVKGSGLSPVQTLTFGVLDKAVKTAFYKQMLEKGLPPTMAADWTNHFLIDYSARNLNPRLRMYGHALMPYFGWRVGNAMLHIPNALENPGKYIMMNYVRDYLSDSIMHTNPYDREKMPAALTEAIFLPMRYATGNQAVAFPDFPQDPYFRLVKRSVIDHPTNPLQWQAEAARFMFSRSRLSNMLYRAFVNKKQIDKESFWDTFYGKGNRSGYLQDTLWGLSPAARMAESLWDPERWQDIGPDLLGFLMRVQPVTPQGKVQQ